MTAGSAPARGCPPRAPQRPRGGRRRAGGGARAGRLGARADLAAALANSAERHLEAVTQGAAFITAVEKSWPCAAVARLRRVSEGPVAYPPAVGGAARG